MYSVITDNDYKFEKFPPIAHSKVINVMTINQILTRPCTKARFSFKQNETQTNVYEGLKALKEGISNKKLSVYYEEK